MLTKIKNIAGGAGVLLLLPFVAFAQNLDYFDTLLTNIGDIVDALVPVVIGIALVVFIVGLIRFIYSGDDPEKRAGARHTMVWGIIILLVIVSIWGIIEVLQGALNIEGGGTTTIPDVPN